MTELVTVAASLNRAVVCSEVTAPLIVSSTEPWSDMRWGEWADKVHRTWGGDMRTWGRDMGWGHGGHGMGT